MMIFSPNHRVAGLLSSFISCRRQQLTKRQRNQTQKGLGADLDSLAAISGTAVPVNHDSFAFSLASKLFLSTSSPVPCGSIAIPGTILETINLAFFLSSAGTTYQSAASSYPDV
jgi:hypothetical protein